MSVDTASGKRYSAGSVYVRAVEETSAGVPDVEFRVSARVMNHV